MSRWLLAAGVSAILGHASLTAATLEFKLLVDFDNDSSTGCRVHGMAGIEHLVVTTITTTESAAHVVSVNRQECGPFTLGLPIAVSAGGWPVAWTSAQRLDLETKVPRSALSIGETVPKMRLAFVGAFGLATEIIAVGSDGLPILYPRSERRRAVGHPGSPRLVVLDGMVADWAGIDAIPLARTATEMTELSLLEVFLWMDGNDLFLRFVADANVSAPAAASDSYTVQQGTSMAVVAPGVLQNDSDPSGSALTASGVSDPEHGVLSLNPAGGFSYFHDGSPTVIDSFEYKATNDSGAESNVATVEITITENEPPLAQNDSYVVPEGGTLDVTAPGILANDSDPDTAAGTWTLEGGTQPTHGNLTLGGAGFIGGFTYVHDGSETTGDSFSYRIGDGLSPSNTATVTISVTPANDTPVAANESYGTNEDTVLTILAPGVLGNDTDADGTSLVATLVANAANGNVVLDANGGFAYTPGPDFNGTDTFQYAANDGTASHSATVTITMNAINDPPTFASGGTVTVNEDSGAYDAPWATAIHRGALNEAPQTLAFSVPHDTNAALFTVLPSIDASTGNLTFTPAPDANGSADITVTLSDDGSNVPPNGNTSAPVTFAIQVTSISDPPAIDAAANLHYIEASGAVVIDDTVTLADLDDANLGSVTVAVSANYLNGEDILAFTNAFGVTGSFDAPNGTLTLTGPASLADFQSAVRTVTYTNASTTPSVAPRTLTWTVTDPAAASGSDTSTITITAINTAPALTAGGTLSYTENDAAIAADITITAADVDSLTLAGATVQLTTNYLQGEDVLSYLPALGITGLFDAPGGTLALTGTASAADYQTALRNVLYHNTSDAPSTMERTLTWTINDGATDSNTQTTTITVDATNDAPVNALPTAQNTNEETPLTLSGTNAISIADVDADPDDVQVTLNVTLGTVALNSAALGSLTSLTGDASNTVVATGTIAEINAALDGLTFWPAADETGAGAIQVVTNDLGNSPSGALTDTDALTITINPVNDAPVLALGGLPIFAENGTPVSLAGMVLVTDVDDPNIESATIRISGNFQSGADVLAFVNAPPIMGSFTGDTLTLNGSDSKANYVAALYAVTYSNTSENPSELQRMLTWKLNDGDADSDTAGSAVDVTATNDAPVNAVPAAQSTDEDTPLTFSTASGNKISIGDVDANLDDVQITLNVTLGTVVLNPAATSALAALLGNGSSAVEATGTIGEINAALDGLTFIPTGDANGAGAIQVITYDLGHNPSGILTDTDSVAISINPVNEAPVLSVTGALSYTENDPATPLLSSATITDMDGTNLGTASTGATIQLTANYVSGQDVLSFSNTASITGTFVAGTGTLTLSGVDTRFSYEAALQSVRYTNTSESPSPLTRTVSWRVDDGESVNSLSAVQTSTISITSVNDAPSVTDETHQTMPNVTFQFSGAQTQTPAFFRAGNVLSNDTGGPAAESQTISISAIQGSAAAIGNPIATAQGGSVTMQANGTYVYLPPAGGTTDDSFTYDVRDTEGILSGGDDTTTGTVTIDFVAATRVWFVRNNAAPGGLGRSTDPFDTLGEAEAASANGDIIFVHRGDGLSTGQSAGIALKPGQNLWGETIGLTYTGATVNGTSNPVLVSANVANRPLIDGAIGLTDLLALDTTEVIGFSLSGNRAFDFTTTGASATGTLTVQSNVIRSSTTEGIRIAHGGTGTATVNILSNNWTGMSGGNAIEVTRTAGDMVLVVSLNTTIRSSATGINIDGGNLNNTNFIGFSKNTVHGDTGGTGIAINNVRLDVGGPQELVTGVMTIGASGNGVGGAGMTVANVKGSFLFKDLRIFTDGGAGLTVAGLGAFNRFAFVGTELVEDGSAIIEATGGPALDISNTSMAMFFDRVKSINTPTTGVSLVNVVNGRNVAMFQDFVGSSITTTATATGPIFNISGGRPRIGFGGTITNSSPLARAVLITGQSGASFHDILLSGAIVENGAGILVSGNSGNGSITFSGGMQIHTTTGEGFAATSNTNTPGLQITGTNTIDSTSATALRVTDTVIGSSGLHFRSISSNGAASGIVLSNTGGVGGLAVEGNGGTCSSAATCTGGVIQNTTGPAISLTATTNASFTRMFIGGTAAPAIQGANVNGAIQFYGNVLQSIGGSDAVFFQQNSGGLCTYTGANSFLSGGVNISLNQTGGFLQIPQADLATLASANVGSTTSSSGTILFNGPCGLP